jgi:hypothetical protein
MDVHHKHKPVHNWREFAKEVGIIVLGVLIALGGEQAVEAIHHHYELRDLEAALNEEVAFDLASMKESVDLAPCVNRRLDELARWQRSFALGRPLKLAGEIGTPATRIFRTSVWRSATGNAADLMPLDRRMTYALFYDSVDFHAQIRSRADGAFDDLSLLEHAQTLNQDQQLRIAHDVRTIRVAYRMLQQDYATWLNTYASALHVAPDPNKLPAASEQGLEEARATFCKPLFAS